MVKVLNSNEFAENNNLAQKYRIAAVPVENLAGFMPEQNITNKVNAHL